MVATVCITLPACQNDTFLELEDNNLVKEGYISIRFHASIPDMKEVQARGVDPDGLDISSMMLYCFNSYGLMTDAVPAVLSKDAATPSLSGTFTAEIPEDTHIIHFLANQNANLYPVDNIRGKSEVEVIAAMEGASGMMIYWQRFEYNEETGGTINNQLNALNGTDSTRKGVELIRNQAKVSIGNTTWSGGSFTVAGFAATNIHAYGTVAPYYSNGGFVYHTYTATNNAAMPTLPVNTSMMSGITDVNTATEDYIFEHENSVNNPVSVIIKGKNSGDTDDLYYRVMLLDSNGNQLPIIRNHSYVLNITGALAYGQSTFEAALEAPATNNVLVSVESWVNEVTADGYTLNVEKTSVVLGESEIESLKDKELTLNYTLTHANSQLTMPTVEWVGNNTVAANAFTPTFDTTNGKGTITVTLEDLGTMNSRTGTLMIKHGRLYRTIEITTIKEQSFVPTWITTELYGGSTGNKSTLVFTIPETCPKALYPFSVLISVNSLDVRYTSGQTLPVLVKGDDGYFGLEHIDYKYEYTVEGPGVHRVYFENILQNTNNTKETVHLEANHFTTLSKEYSYSDQQIGLFVQNLTQYSSGYATDDRPYYIKVPQKKGAEISLNVIFNDLSAIGTAVNVTDGTPFKFYTQYLDYPDVTATTDIDNGRVLANISPSANNNVYTVKMTTNRAKSEEVVRITAADKYRSFIFNVDNYHPFHFGAKVDEVGTIVTGENVEDVDELEWVYAPEGTGKNITLSLSKVGDDITPFGTAFNIYIDAPMLEINGSVTGLTEDTNTAGRFVYTVPADQTSTSITLPFKTKKIASTGKIVITSEEDKVVFYEKTFKVLNTPIEGTITYGNSSTAVAANSFVAFSRKADGTRIGAITVNSDGHFELKLRPEYEINWDDEVEFTYKNNNVTYSQTSTLSDLVSSTNNILKMTEN